MSVILTICMTDSRGTMPAECLTLPSSVLGGSKPPLPSPIRAEPSSLSAISKLPPAEHSPRNDCNSSFSSAAENEGCRAIAKRRRALYVLGTKAANYLSRQSGTTADDPAIQTSTITGRTILRRRERRSASGPFATHRRCLAGPTCPAARCRPDADATANGRSPKPIGRASPSDRE
jgi:hypothetical protein